MAQTTYICRIIFVYQCHKNSAILMKLDLIDRKVLEILQSNAKITNAQLSKEIGLSPAPTLERVKKLEQHNIIKSYHAHLDRESVGLGVTTFIQVTLT
ncbi:MAG: Lrp/AsnC family transcriptional regulator, partial [Runella slithyformis]